MNYLIAYKDNEGKDFYGKPWLIPDGGTEDLSFAKMIKEDFLKRGFKDVTIFSTNDIPEEVEWEFVEENKIVE